MEPTKELKMSKSTLHDTVLEAYNAFICSIEEPKSRTDVLILATLFQFQVRTAFKDNPSTMEDQQFEDIKKAILNAIHIMVSHPEVLLPEQKNVWLSTISSNLNQLQEYHQNDSPGFKM